MVGVHFVPANGPFPRGLNVSSVSGRGIRAGWRGVKEIRETTLPLAQKVPRPIWSHSQKLGAFLLFVQWIPK